MAGEAVHLALVVVRPSVGGADGADDSLAPLGAGAFADALLGRGTLLSERAGQLRARIQAWKNYNLIAIVSNFSCT